MEIEKFDKVLEEVNYLIKFTGTPEDIITYKFVERDELFSYSTSLEIRRGNTLIFRESFFTTAEVLEKGNVNFEEVKENLINRYLLNRIIGKSAQEVAIEKGEIKIIG